jgi:hypothetical protein
VGVVNPGIASEAVFFNLVGRIFDNQAPALALWPVPVPENNDSQVFVKYIIDNAPVRCPPPFLLNLEVPLEVQP